MNEVSEPLKLKCINHHTFFYYDEKGLHCKCNRCKIIREVTWEELQTMYLQTREASTSERRVLY